MRYALQFSWFQAPSVGSSHVHNIFGRISCCNTHSAPNSQQDLLGSFIYHKNSICFIQVYIYTRHGSVNVKPVFVFQLLAGQTCSRKTKRPHKDVGKARTANLVEKLNYLERKRRKEWKPNIPKKKKRCSRSQTLATFSQSMTTQVRKSSSHWAGRDETQSKIKT